MYAKYVKFQILNSLAFVMKVLFGGKWLVEAWQFDHGGGADIGTQRRRGSH